MHLNRFKSNLLKVLPQNSFARGVSIIVGGTVGVQALLLLASPILTRLYSPEDFGLLAIYSSILSLFSVIASLRYNLAIPISESEDDALNLVKLSLIITSLFTLLSIAIVYISADWLSNITHQPKLKLYLWLIPVGIFLISTYESFHYWSLRQKSYSLITKTRITQSLIGLAVQLTLFKFNALALILGRICNQGAGITSLSRPLLNIKSFKQWELNKIKSVAVEYKNYPIYSTWEGLLNTAGSQLPPLFFGIFFSVTTAGLYSLAHKVLSQPLAMIGRAIGHVFITNAAESYRQKKLGILFEQLYSNLSYMILPVLILILIDGPKLFSIIFGKEWIVAGDIARLMIPWLATVFIASPMSTLFSIVDKQAYGMIFQGLLLILRVLAIFIGYKLNSMIIAITLFSLFSSLCWIGFLIWASVISESKPIKLITNLIKPLMYSLICLSPLILIKLTINNNFTFWLIAFGLSVVLLILYYINILKEAYK